MINNLIIKQKSVEIDTEISYSAIEIRYRGEMYIKNNLPNDFIVRKGNNKIIILRFSKDDTIHTDLFEYSGSCNIYYAMMVDKDLNTYDLLVKKPALELYNTFKGAWESMTTNYEDMNFNGNNSRIKAFKQVSSLDAETNTITTTKETTIKPSYLGKKDVNLTRLSNLGTKKQKRIKRGY